MTDAPKIHATLSDLDSAAKAGAFVQALNGGKRITFPDPGEMEWTAAEEFLQDLQSRDTRGMLEKWLSEADFKKLLDAKLNLYQISALGKLVNSHYEAIFGDQGNGIGS
ncbi:hypothetical protein [Glutamicibacter protophormiae]|uniref:hypothetical protein n=1 Tax=Glutamicibacter protophormiae TaxID=37930 RepID=UPI003A8D6F48